jgi:FKBP-type peptidyl-prolyl cis-trans isomerase FklB
MKRISYAFLFISSLTGTALNAEEAPTLTTDEQKFGYAIGLQIGQGLLQQGAQVDVDALTLAIKDMLAKKEPRLSQDELQKVVQKQKEKLAKTRKESAEKNLAASKAFLEENKKKEGVKTLPSGLQYKVITEGKGEKPKATDTVSVHYRGTLINGAEFDSSYKSGNPVTFQVGNVIKGWQEALPLMPAGSKWQVFIPPDLAYGDQGAGGAIGPNEALLFDIELLAVNPESKDKKEKTK